MIAAVRRRVATVVVAVAALAGLAACAQLGYYTQSVEGHLAVLRAARPIDEWVRDPETPPRLRARLERVRAMRRFAVSELALPDNRSYTTYADIHRPFVVWNVFATPELSLALRQSCFPVVGCVSYRGYYDKADAERFADSLRANGDDAYVGGVPAYSTLGYTTDPVLSTFVDFSEGEVARLIFHELAHQVVYVQGDTAFNESFAVAVEEEGTRRWFAADRSDPAAFDAYRLTVARRRAFVALLAARRQALAAAYAESADDDARRVAKREQFAALAADHARAKADPASPLFGYAGYDRYFAQSLNNANLAAVATYTQRVPAFAKLLAEEGGDLSRFYAAVRELAKLPIDRRNARLDSLDPAPDGRTDATPSQ